MGHTDIELVINHFSHHHPLQLSNIQKQPLNTSICSGCKLKSTGYTYSCKACNYYLHISCAQMPRQIRHPVDPNHALTLFTSPVYPEAVFRCNACGHDGTGFCFHCSKCELDVHILCALKPLSVNHVAHHHPLKLAFFTPYNNNCFSCDICKGSGSNHWLYRCDTCQFDAHMSCAMTKPKSPPRPQRNQPQVRQVPPTPPPPQHLHQHQRQRVMFPYNPPQSPVLGNRYVGNYYPPIHQVNRHVHRPSNGVPQYVMPMERVGSGGRLMESAAQGLVEGLAQQAGQALVQGFMGGSGSSFGLGIGSAILGGALGLN